MERKKLLLQYINRDRDGAEIVEIDSTTERVLHKNGTSRNIIQWTGRHGEGYNNSGASGSVTKEGFEKYVMENEPHQTASQD